MNTNYYTHPLKLGTRLPDDSEIVKVYDMTNEDKAILTEKNGVTTSEEKLKEIDEGVKELIRDSVKKALDSPMSPVTNLEEDSYA